MKPTTKVFCEYKGWVQISWCCWSPGMLEQVESLVRTTVEKLTMPGLAMLKHMAWVNFDKQS